ncbi:MAG: hypothetical protein RDU89_09985 [bacterium]|nr:hypothetical protein [bacterium]
MKRLAVRSDGGGRPVAVRWEGRFLLARILDAWEDAGAWWEGEGEKNFYRVELTSGPLVELCRDTGTGSWYVYRVYD